MTPLVITFYSNGDVWVSKEVNFAPPTTGTGSEAGTVVKHFRLNGDVSAQKITTLTGSGNSSASALAASGGATTRHGKIGLDTDDFS